MFGFHHSLLRVPFLVLLIRNVLAFTLRWTGNESRGNGNGSGCGWSVGWLVLGPVTVVAPAVGYF